MTTTTETRRRLQDLAVQVLGPTAKVVARKTGFTIYNGDERVSGCCAASTLEVWLNGRIG